MSTTVHTFDYKGRTITLRQTQEGVTAIDGDLLVVFRGARLRVENGVVDVKLPFDWSSTNRAWSVGRGKA